MNGRLVIMVFCTVFLFCCGKSPDQSNMESSARDSLTQEQKGQGEEKQDGPEQEKGEIDEEFIAAMKTLAVYDPSISDSAGVILEKFEEDYKSREAVRVLNMAKRIWMPDPGSGAVIRSGGFVKGGGVTFRFQRGDISQQDKAFMEAYARYLTAPDSERENVRKHIPSEGISPHLKVILKD